MAPKQRSLDFGQALDVPSRRAPVIHVCFVLAPGTAYGLSKYQTKMYTATALLVFNNSQTNQHVAVLQALSGDRSQQAQQSTDLKLLKFGDMTAKVADGLDQGPVEKTVREDLRVTALGESDLAAVASTLRLAADIISACTEQFVTVQQSSNHAGEYRRR